MDKGPSTYIPSTSVNRLYLLKPSDQGCYLPLCGIFPNLIVKSVLKNGPGLRKNPERIFIQMSSFFPRTFGQTLVPTSKALPHPFSFPSFMGTCVREKVPVLLHYPNSAWSSFKTFRKSSSKNRQLLNQSHSEAETTFGPCPENSV